MASSRDAEASGILAMQWGPDNEARRSGPGAAYPRRVRLPRNPWARWPILVIGSYCVFLAALMLFENKLIFHPMRYPEGDWSPRGIEVEDAWFQADDGTRLHGWYVPLPSPKAVVLFTHGNGGNLTHRQDALHALRGLGAATLIFDYRGYGRSAGSPTGAGIIADARAARSWLATRAGLPPERLVLFGESLGGAVATRLASEGGARGLILQNTFDSLAAVAARHYPWAPVRLLLRTRLESSEAIRTYRGPLLQFHGDADSIVPYDCGRRLFDAANEPKELVTIPGGDHNDDCSPAFWSAVGRFLERI
jgi:uncharacterized protein